MEHIADISKRNRRSTNRLDNSFHKYTPEVAARPVDTYVHHQAPEDAGRNYRSLAASLAGIAPAINQFLKQKHDEQVAKDEATGTRLYHETGGERLSWEDWRKKHDKRLEETGVSTSVRNGYLKARMANEANIFRTQLNDAYASGKASITLPNGQQISVAESDDPSAFNLWVNRFTSEYIKTNLGVDADPEYFAKIFVPQLEQSTQELASKHISERNNILNNKNMSEHNKLIEQDIRKLIKDGGFDMSDPNVTVVAKRIEDSIRSMVASGVSTEKARAAAVERLKVLGHNPDVSNGEDLFDIARQVMMHDGSSLWDSGRTAYELTIAAEQIRKERKYREREEKQDKEEAERERRKQDAAALAVAVLNGRSVPSAMRDAFIMEYGPDVYSAIVSQVRNIKNGFDPKSAGGGGGGGGRGSTAAATKAAKEMKRKFMTGLITALKTGNIIPVEQVVSHPVFAELTPSEQLQIFRIYEQQVDDAKTAVRDSKNELKDWKKNAGKHVDAVVDSSLEADGIDPKSELGLYMRSSISLNVASAMDKAIKENGAVVLGSPENYNAIATDLARKATTDAKAKRPMYEFGLGSGLSPWQTDEMNMGLEKQAAKAAALASASNNAAMQIVTEATSQIMHELNMGTNASAMLQ